MKLVPKERVHQRSVQHPTVPQFLEETVEVVMVPTERVATADCRCANAADYGRDSRDGIGPTLTSATADCRCATASISGRDNRGGRIVDIPQCREEAIEAVRLVPRERVQQRTAEQMSDESGRNRRGWKGWTHKYKCINESASNSGVALSTHFNCGGEVGPAGTRATTNRRANGGVADPTNCGQDR